MENPFNQAKKFIKASVVAGVVSVGAMLPHEATGQNHDKVDNKTEQLSKENEKDPFYSACIGYLAGLSQYEMTDIARKSALKECRVYFENLRDGVEPKTLGNEAQIVWKTVLDQINKASQEEIARFIEDGKNLKTI